MKLLLKSDFPQFRLLNIRDFLKELQKRDITLSESDLEYFDKVGIIRPCLRLILPDSDERQSSFSIHNSPFKWKQLFSKKLLEFPKEGDFKSWKTFESKNIKKSLYYHPKQILFIKEQILPEKYVIKGRSLNQKINDPAKTLKYHQNIYLNSIKWMKKKTQDCHNYLVGLLMLLEEPYKPILINRIYLNNNDLQHVKKWEKWKKTTYNPNSFLKKSKLSVSELKKIYQDMVYDVTKLDPINQWNPFPQIIKRNKKLQLEGIGLYAQDYFDALEFLKFFIKDLSKEIMPSPYDSGNWYIDWKELKYGKPYDINSTKTQKLIISDFTKFRPIITSIIYEGDTEKIVITNILKAINVGKPKIFGINLYNICGSGNLNQKNLDGFISRSLSESDNIYVIIDKDAERLLKKHIDSKTLKQENCVIWDKDFELDNFGLSKVVEVINKELKKKKLKPISTKSVTTQMNKKSSLFKALHDILYKEQSVNLEKDIISKPKLAMKILQPRMRQIKKEYRDNKWIPTYPIEKELSKILNDVKVYYDRSIDH